MMHKDEYAIMALAEREHWWYRSLHAMVLRYINRFFTSKEIDIVDAGCGTGGLMSYLMGNGYNHISGFDLSPVAVQLSRQNHLEVNQGSLQQVRNYYTADSKDVVICADALYFLNETEQRRFTDDVNLLLRKDGLLIINLPAFNAFSGMHDLRVGITRRYHKNTIQHLLDSTKYQLLYQVYWPFILSPVIWLARLVQRYKMKLDKQVRIKSDVRSENAFINAALFFITNTENRLLGAKPFGSSLFLVAKKLS